MSYEEDGAAGELTYDVRKQSVRYGARRARLPDLSFRMLRLLAEREPAAVGFEEIERVVWGAQVTRETMKQRAKLLRDALTDLGAPEDAVAAVRSVGYRLTIPGRPREQPEPQGVLPSKPVRWVLAAAVACAAGVAALIITEPWRSAPNDFQLAIVAASGDAADDELTIRRDLATELAGVEGLDVLASAQDSLRSDLVLSYAIAQRSVGQNMSVQLVDRHSGLLLWAREYPLDSAGNERTVSHIAANVHAKAQALALVLGRDRLPAQPQAAQQEYMAVLELTRGAREADLVVARGRLDALIARRPNFALARSLRARVMANLVIEYGHTNDLAAAAVAEAQTLVADYPFAADFRYTLARAEWSAGNRTVALDHLNVAARSMPFLQRDIQALEREIAAARVSNR